jgi:hypothetical protein
MATRNSPNLLTVDPAVQAIFDAMDTALGSTYVTINASESKTAQGTNYAVYVTDKHGNTQNYSTSRAGTKVVVTPTTASLGPGEVQQFTAKATDPNTGADIPLAVFDWAVVNGQGTIDTDGYYYAPDSVSASSFDQLSCTLQGDLASTSFSVSLHT